MKSYAIELLAFNKRYLKRLADKFEWNVTHMVEYSGIARTQMYRMLRQADLTPPPYDMHAKTREDNRATH